MNKALLFLVFMFTSLSGWAQTGVAEKNVTTEVELFQETASPSILLIDPVPKLDSKLDIMNMPASFSYEELGIFCKMEYKIAKKVPLKIRLGEVKYTEKLEGK